MRVHGRPELPEAAPVIRRRPIQGDDRAGEGWGADFRPAMPRDAIDRGAWWTMYGDPTLDQLRRRSTSPTRPWRRPKRPTARRAPWSARTPRVSIRRFPAMPALRKAAAAPAPAAARKAACQHGNGQPQPIHRRPLARLADRCVGRIRRQIESDSAAAQASAADLANARLSAQANLAINYFSMRISEQRIRVFQASVTAFTRSAEIVQNQLDAGIVSRVDLAQAQTQLEQTRAQLVAEGVNRASSSMPSRC